MGVKGKAAVAIILILLFLGSMWLQGGLEHHWETCLKVYNQKDQSFSLSNSSGVYVEDMGLLEECPGQSFQVSMLLDHLQASPVQSNDILLQPYLSSWDELIKFIEALGPMVGLISQEIEAKTAVIRELALQEESERGGGAGGGGGGGEREGGRDAGSPVAEGGLSEGSVVSRDEQEVSSAGGGAYVSVRSMIDTELERGLVDFEQTTASGCRTLLRLHRALLWLQLFLQKLGEGPTAQGRLRSPSELCREAYQHTLSQHHSWWVRRAAELAFIAIPERSYFYRLVCVQNQDEATVVLNRVVRAIGEVYERTQRALEEHGMLELP